MGAICVVRGATLPAEPTTFGGTWSSGYGFMTFPEPDVVAYGGRQYKIVSAPALDQQGLISVTLSVIGGTTATAGINSLIGRYLQTATTNVVATGTGQANIGAGQTMTVSGSTPVNYGAFKVTIRDSNLTGNNSDLATYIFGTPS